MSNKNNPKVRSKKIKILPTIKKQMIIKQFQQLSLSNPKYRIKSSRKLRKEANSTRIKLSRFNNQNKLKIKWRTSKSR